MKRSRSVMIGLGLTAAGLAVFGLWPRSVQSLPQAVRNSARLPMQGGADFGEGKEGALTKKGVPASEDPDYAWAFVKPREPDMAKIAAFDAWLGRWKTASPEERAAMVEEGARLAGERREEYKALITADPRKAVESAVPRVLRQSLPGEIVASLERPVSTVGTYNVYMGRPQDGLEIPVAALTQRYFEANGESWRAHAYGDLETVMSRKGVPMQGYAVDGELALAENAVRPLEIGETIPAGTTVQATCPVSKKTTEAVSPGETVTPETPTVEIGGTLITLCDGSHVTVLEGDFRTYIQASGPGGGGYFVDNYPGTSSRAIGNLRCLYIRVTYPDQMAAPNTEDAAYADMRDNARYYLESSYGKMTQTTTVTSLVTLPHTLAWYKAKDSGNGGTIDCLGLVHSDSRAEARKLGYDTNQYDCIIVRVNKGPRLEGISWGGGANVWITWSGMDVLNHECGHSLGRNHANYWSTTDNTAYGKGSNSEYGNGFDVMGGGGGFSAHYNTISKRALGWLPDAYVNLPKTNGVFRVYAYDQPQLEEGKRYALAVAKDSVRTYNLEYHPARGALLADNALVLYSGMGSNAGHLLDTTPGSSGGKNDGGIAIGRTFSDLESDQHFTVVSKNATTPPSLDIAYNRGPFPGNVAPVVTLGASATTITVGGSVTFTATATDADGDALAYYWQFDDGVYGTNTPVFTRTFASAAQVNALLTVSDMKGGSTRRSVTINVGSHGKQAITGFVTSGGNPVQDVRISNGTKFCFSNADGSYSLTGLSTGSNTLTAVLAGYTFTASTANPYTVVSGTNTVNWSSSATTLVTLTKIGDPAEGGASGGFRLTRTGPTTDGLNVLLAPPGGTATVTTDYTFSPNFTTSGSNRLWTIPAGSATLDITVAAVNDTAQEGPETIALQLVSPPTLTTPTAEDGAYVSVPGNSLVLTVVDNDTVLPLVAVTAPDPYAAENGDGATFRFTRTGATTSALSVAVTWSGTAVNGTDYVTLPTTVTIPAGQSQTTLTLTPLDDSLIEVPRDAIATIGTNAAYVRDAGATTATVTISDDDTAVVTVTALEPTALEAGQKPGVFLITRTGSTAAALKVYYGVSGSALHGTDYMALTGEVTIPAGLTSAPVIITPYDDDLGESTETVTLALTTFGNAYSLGTDFQAAINITDNADVPVVSVRGGAVGTEGGTNATFIVRAIGSVAGNISVGYTVSGTATSGVDYTALSGTVSISGNGANDATVTIPITNDALQEPAEKVIITLTPSPAYRIYNDGVTEAVILDNDSGERVQVSTFNQSPSEAPAAGTYYISRTGTTGDLTVNYAMSGTATNGVDYAELSGTAVIPAGALGVDVVMTPINDTLVEGTETATMTIVPVAGSYGLDRVPSATYEIADNDTATLTVGFQAGAQAVSEIPGVNGEYLDIPVVLSAASANTVTVDYTSNGGTASGDDTDWAFVDATNGNKPIPGGTLTFAPGTTSQNLRIRIKNDGVIEGVETAFLLLRAPYNAGLTSGRSQQNISIYDSAVSELVTEERWTSTSVYTNGTWNTVNADYTGFLTGYTPGQDVQSSFSRRLTGKITAPATGSYTFWIASDDGSKLFLSTNATAAAKVQIANVASYTSYQAWDSLSSQKSATINLVAGQQYYMEVQHQDTGGGDHVSVAWQGPGFSRTPIAFALPDTAPRTVRFLTAATTRAETDGSEPKLIALLDRAAGSTAITVDYSLSGTATAGQDYVLAPGTLTFAPGEQAKSLPLTIVADATGEPTETVTVTLSNPTGASLTTPVAHTITITEPGPVVLERSFNANAVMPVGTLIGTLSAQQIGARSVASWQILLGNASGAFALDDAGRLTLANPAALPATGTVSLGVRVTDSAGAIGEGTMTITCGNLLAWWPLDEGTGTSSADLSGNGRTTTFTGTTWSTTANSRVGNSSLTVNGTSQYSTATGIATPSSLTLAAWIYPTTVSGIHTIISQNGSYAFRTNGTKLMLTTPGVLDHTSTGTSLVAATWTHVAVTFQPSTTNGVKFYINGVLTNSVNASAMAVTTNPTILGRTTNFSGQDFGGRIDDVRMYGSVLGAAEITDLYNSTATRAPVFAGGSVINFGVQATEDVAYVASLAGTATDADGDAVSYAKVSGPAWLTVSSTGALGGTPLNANVGTNAFVIRAYDKWGMSSTATFNIAVANTNDAPVFESDPIVGETATQGVAYTGTLAGTANDVDAGATLTYAKVSGPAWLTVAANGTLGGTPGAPQLGTNAFVVKVTDNTGLTATAGLSITVVAGAQPVELWRAAQFPGQTNDPLVAGDLADPDRDGLVNLMEYALGTNPKASTAPPTIETGSPMALKLEMPDPAPADVTYVVEGLSALGGTWSSIAQKTGTAAWVWQAGGTSRLTSGAPSGGKVSVEVGTPDSAGTKYFFRVRVSR